METTDGITEKRTTPKMKYLYHRLPGGATPVPKTGEVDGIPHIRDYNGYRFYYQGWSVSNYYNSRIPFHYSR